MFKPIGKLLVVLTFGWAWSASAGPIVTVGTQQWLQPKDFVNLSRDGIAGVCDEATGVCSNADLGGTNMDGWIWASVADINLLFDKFLTCTGCVPLGGYPTFEGSDIADYEAFLNAGFIETLQGVRVAGFARDRFDRFFVRAGAAARVPVRDAEGNVISEYSWFITLDALYSEIDSRDTGGWFYRAAPNSVPNPPTLLLMGLGLAALGYRRRNIKQAQRGY